MIRPPVASRMLPPVLRTPVLAFGIARRKVVGKTGWLGETRHEKRLLSALFVIKNALAPCLSHCRQDKEPGLCEQACGDASTKLFGVRRLGKPDNSDRPNRANFVDPSPQAPGGYGESSFKEAIYLSKDILLTETCSSVRNTYKYVPLASPAPSNEVRYRPAACTPFASVRIRRPCRSYTDSVTCDARASAYSIVVDGLNGFG